MIDLYVKTYPNNKEFIYDVDSYFGNTNLIDDDYTHKVLKEVEQASFVDVQTFKDRTGLNLRTNCLSTSTKCLLLTHYYPNIVFNCDEIGDNAIDFLESGSIYFSHDCFTIPNCNEIRYNNKIYTKEELELELL